MNYSHLPQCEECYDPCDEKTVSHWTEGPRGDGYGHKGLCCNCFDDKIAIAFEKAKAKEKEDTDNGKSVDHHD